MVANVFIQFYIFFIIFYYNKESNLPGWDIDMSFVSQNCIIFNHNSENDLSVLMFLNDSITLLIIISAFPNVAVYDCRVELKMFITPKTSLKTITKITNWNFVNWLMIPKNKI